MTRRVVTALYRAILWVFFSRIEIKGQERVPSDGPVIFVLNHPSALLDPLFVLCMTPRPASFLAKSTLFKMPVIGTIIRAFDSVPVYRRQDEGENTNRNAEMFEAARKLLTSGGSLALFPEGVSHSDSKLKPLKTGAARIAYGAAEALAPAGEALKIVPAGLYYTAKTTFRSSALVYFGEPIEVEPVALDAGMEPAFEDVRALTERLAVALDEVTLQADHHTALELIERVEQMFSAADEDDSAAPLSDRFALRKRFMEGFELLRVHAPERLEALEARILAYETDRLEVGLTQEPLTPEAFAFSNVLSYGLKSLAWLLFLMPLALIGTLVYFPAYQGIDALAMRFSKGEDDMIATLKVLAAMLLFPITWIVVVVAGGLLGALPGAFLAGALTPIVGLAALWFWERFAHLRDAAHGLAVFVARRGNYERLCAERVAIREEIIALGELVEGLKEAGSGG